MKISDIINETTGVGGVAVAAQPMGSMVSRSGPKKKKKRKKTSEASAQDKLYKRYSDITKQRTGKSPEEHSAEFKKDAEEYRNKIEKQKKRIADLERKQQEFEKLNELDLNPANNRGFEEVGEYKNYTIYRTVKKFKDQYFIALATIDGDVFKVEGKELKAQGETRKEAVNNLINKIDYILNAQKINTAAIIDFNAPFVRQILNGSRDKFYAKLDVINGEPSLIIAGTEFLEFGDDLKSLGFKISSLRMNPESENAVALPAIGYSANQITPLGLINNGRYLVGDGYTDDDGNTVYPLSYHSTVHTSSDKKRLTKPALTVASLRKTR